MGFGSFDISFCHGKAETEKDGAKLIIDCPVKNKCHRYWTDWHTQQAIKTNDTYHSFIIPSAENISENGCDHFWKEI